MVARIRMTQSFLVLVLISTLCLYICKGEEPQNVDEAEEPLPADDTHIPDDPEAPIDSDASADPDTPADSDAPVDSAPVDGQVKEGAEGEVGVPGVGQPIVRVSCYECNSAYDGEKCESSEPQDLAPFLKPCPQEYVRCRKAQQLVQGDRRVVRSCATLGSAKLGGEDVCIDRSGSLKIVTRTCDCFNSEPGQPCNTATHNTLTSSLTWLLLLTSLLAAVRRYSS